MKFQRWHFGLISIIAIVLVVILVWYWVKPLNTETTSDKNQVFSQANGSENYFSDTANVMYFYSDYCSWCIEEKKVLTELGNEGYKVKSMNIGNDQSLISKYSIEGTPTFISNSGDKLVGYQKKDALKTFLDKNK